MTKEEVYDTQISPLMQQIVAICLKNKIEMIANYELDTRDNQNLSCQTMLPGEDGNHPHYLLVAKILRDPPSSFSILDERSQDVEETNEPERPMH